MKYNLFKGKKILGTFPSYERARQEARKVARQLHPSHKREKLIDSTGIMWDGISRNPSNLTALGFRIKQA